MITVEKALLEIKKHSNLLHKRVKSLSLNEALGAVLAETIKAPISLPSFRQSAMDGYAIRCHDKKTYKVVSKIKAGDPFEFELNPGEALRIFTGAGVPDSANAIVMQELVDRDHETITTQKAPTIGQNIRKIGEQIKKEDIVFENGTQLNPPALGILQSLGLTEVKILLPPKVAVIITGNELEKTGKPLQVGKIYESNSIVLKTVLKQMGIITDIVEQVEDDITATQNAIEKALNQSHLVLISGGISVGDFDFVGQALEQIGVEKLFYRVKQKPGKPLFFGKYKQTLLFALPGNPASTLNCFYVFVYPLLQALMGRSSSGLLRIKYPLADDFENTSDRALFLKAKIQNGVVTPLTGQASSMIKTFAMANALVYIPLSKKKFKKGEKVETLILPHGN
tara:strand:- start:5023 stop:6210 length:1188 start_codon:yes stop_codon:yes gene_type:complete